MENGQDHSASGAALLGVRGNGSKALNKFLEDVLQAQKDFKWMDRAAGRADQEPRLDE